jgi:hypothetical protein
MRAVLRVLKAFVFIYSFMYCLCQIPLGDSDRLNAIPSLVGKEISLKGVGWKESAADIILSSLGRYKSTAWGDEADLENNCELLLLFI